MCQLPWMLYEDREFLGWVCTLHVMIVIKDNIDSMCCFKICSYLDLKHGRISSEYGIENLGQSRET